MKKLILIIFTIILIALCIGFASMNSGQLVSVEFLGLRLRNEFWVFVIASLLIGASVGYLFAMIGLMKLRVKARALNKKLTKAEQEVINLRNLPIKEDI